MKYTDFREGDAVEYRGCRGKVFALVTQTLDNILIEFDTENSFSWTSKGPGLIPRDKRLNNDKWYFYPTLEDVLLIKKEEEIYEIY